MSDTPWYKMTARNENKPDLILEEKEKGQVDTPWYKMTAVDTKNATWERIMVRIGELVKEIAPVKYTKWVDIDEPVSEEPTMSLSEMEEWLRSGKRVTMRDRGNGFHRFVAVPDECLVIYRCDEKPNERITGSQGGSIESTVTTTPVIPNAISTTLPEAVPMDWSKVLDRLITLIAIAQPVTYFLLKEVGIVDHETTSVSEVEAWLKSGKPVNAVDGDNVLHRFIPDFERGVLNYRTTFKTEILK